MVKARYDEPQVKIELLSCTDVLTISWEDGTDYGKDDVGIFF